MSDARLDLVSVVGLSSGEDTLLLHPDGTLIYPLGSTIVLRDKDDGKAQARVPPATGARNRLGLGARRSRGSLHPPPPAPQEFLQGHSDCVSALALSRSGNLLASGQRTYLGFPADVGRGRRKGRQTAFLRPRQWIPHLPCPPQPPKKRPADHCLGPSVAHPAAPAAAAKGGGLGSFFFAGGFTLACATKV
jgi:hypothetical protein